MSLVCMALGDTCFTELTIPAAQSGAPHNLFFHPPLLDARCIGRDSLEEVIVKLVAAALSTKLTIQKWATTRFKKQQTADRSPGVT